MKKLASAVVCLILACAPWRAAAESTLTDYDDLRLHTREGTVEFDVKVLKDVSADPHNHPLFMANSWERDSTFDIEIVEDQINCRRYFNGCILAAFGGAHNFHPGEWHRVKLTWNGPSTKFIVDGREIKRLTLHAGDDLPGLYPCIRLGHDGYVKAGPPRLSGIAEIYPEPQDEEFVRNCACPELDKLVAEGPQEEYRGIQLFHFPDGKSRSLIESYISLLPEDFCRAIRRVVFVDKRRQSGRGEAGMADTVNMTLYLEEQGWDQPEVFFHEAAHLYDAKLSIAYGVPEDQSEWTSISGASCYYKGGKKEVLIESLKTNDQDGFLGGQGKQCPFEDLALWVGEVYKRYLKNRTFAEQLTPGNQHYDPKTQRKVDYLLGRGFFTQQIYDKVMRKK